MYTALALALTLGGPKTTTGQLEIANVRGTYGYLGATRPKSGVLPGDVYHYAFDIKNLKFDKHARAYFSIGVEIFDPKGQLFYRELPRNSTAQNHLGGNSLPCAAHIAVPLNADPGEYTMKITIRDRKADNKSVEFTSKGKVLKADFGLIRVGTFADREGKVPWTPVGVVGESVYIHFAPVNFARDKTTKQPSLAVKMRILDEKGKPTFAEPLTGRVNSDVPEDVRFLPMQFPVTLNRPGRYTVEIEATCEVCSRTARVRLPLRVLKPE